MTTAPADPRDAALYLGHVMHMRLRPRAHRFRYASFTLLIDLDRAAEIAGRLRLLSFDGRGLFRLLSRDHGPRDGSPLRPWVEARLAEAGRPRPARIRLLAMPRLLGFVFNPISVYFCEDAAGRIESILYEVKNTFGDQIPYVVDATGDGVRRHGVRKAMFVSPFIDFDQTYRFDVAEPGARLALRIKQGDGDGDLLIATLTGDRKPLTDGALARLALGSPFATLKVVAAIHWQALRLWLKGAPFRRYPGPEGAFPGRSETLAPAGPPR